MIFRFHPVVDFPGCIAFLCVFFGVHQVEERSSTRFFLEDRGERNIGKLTERPFQNGAARNRSVKTSPWYYDTMESLEDESDCGFPSPAMDGFPCFIFVHSMISASPR